MLLRFVELAELLNHIYSKLPNFSLDDNKSLTKDQLDSLLNLSELEITNLLLTQPEYSTEGNLNAIGKRRRSQTLLVQQKIREKIEEANSLLLQLNQAFLKKDERLVNQMYREFYNKYLTWFSTNCFDENQVDVLRKVRSQEPDEAIKGDLVVINHKQNTKHEGQNNTVVIGAGPTGLLASLKLYEAGAKINLIEARSGEQLHTRKQTVVLDPTILSELRHYLGTKAYTELFKKGYIFPNGRGFLVIRDLEKALMKRLVQISEADPQGMQIHTGMKAVKIIPPNEENPSFRVGIQDSDISFECDYVYCSEGSRNHFSKARYLLKTQEHASVKTNETPNAFVTMIYDIVEDKPETPFQTAGQLTHIKKIPDEFQPSPEQVESFIAQFKQSSEEDVNHLVSNITNREIAAQIRDSFFELLNSENYKLKLNDKDNNLRTFEANGEFYIASRVPMVFEEFMRLLNQVIKDPSATQKNKELARSIQKNLQDEFSNLLANKFPFLKDRRVKLDHQSSQSFLVNPQGTSLAARVLTHHKQEMMLVAGGDLFRAPHFYSGSGISSAHAEVNAFVEYFSDIQENPRNKSAIREYFLSKMRHIARFVDGKMGEYCNVKAPLLTPVSISIEEVGSDALVIEQLIEQIREHSNSLKQGLSSFWVVRWLFQGLREDKVSILEQLVSKLQQETTYNRCRAVMHEELTEDKVKKLHSHRYNIWSSSSTKSDELIGKLSSTLDRACAEEHVYTETPEVNV